MYIILTTFATKFIKDCDRMMNKSITFLVSVFTLLTLSLYGQSHDHNHGDHDHGHSHGTEIKHEAHVANHDDHAHASHGDAHTGGCGDHHGHGDFDMAGTAIHHISDANVYSILDAVHIPLPTMLYAPSKGWDFFMSNKFGIGHHEDGHKSYNGYVMHHGSVHRVAERGFPMEGSVEVNGFYSKPVEIDGKVKDQKYVCYGGTGYKIDRKSTLDGGILGGGLTSFYDFSITKKVVAMLIVSLLLLWLFSKAAKRYATDPNKAPRGLQGFLEPLVLFVRDEIARPFIGKKYMKYMPFLLSIFFFILGLNFFGQIPFLGSVNATGNLALTMVLAVIVFLVVNFSGNKHYWKHIFWMPGVPSFVKPLLAVVEGMGLFIKPITLMLRLAGNISAGHIAILAFIGLIFILGDSGQNLGGGVAGTALSIPLTMFMMGLELIVAFVQAFVFTILAASYIGSAIEEHH